MDQNKADASWWLYLLRTADGALYCGISTDVERRLAEHLGGPQGAKFLRGRGPLKLELKREVGSRSAALRLERRIKRLARRQKEALVGEPRVLDGWVAALVENDGNVT